MACYCSHDCDCARRDSIDARLVLLETVRLAAMRFLSMPKSRRDLDALLAAIEATNNDPLTEENAT